MTIPTFVGRTVFAHGTGPISVDFTSLSGGSGAFAAGDKLYVAVESANQAITAPTGFTEDTSSPQSVGTAAAAGGVRLGLFSKVADGTETTISVGDSGDHTTAIGYAWRPASGETLSVEATTGTTQVTGATATITWPAVTTTVNNCIILNFVALDRDLISANAVGAPTNASLANLTRRGGETTTDGQGGGVGLVSGELATAGSSGTTTASQGSSVAWAAITIALKGTGGGSQSLTPALFTNTQTFYAPTVTRGAVTLTPSLFSNAQTFYSPTVTQSTTLHPSLFTNSQSFFAPTVRRGAVTLSPSKLTNSQTFFGPTVSARYTLSPALLSNSQTFYGPTVSVGAVTLHPALFTNPQTFFSPHVMGGTLGEWSRIDPATGIWTAVAGASGSWSGQSASGSWSSVPGANGIWTDVPDASGSWS
jgi:hypothetical protein